MHDPVTKNFCHLLTWETRVKKLIGREESCGSWESLGVRGHTGDSRANTYGLTVGEALFI